MSRLRLASVSPSERDRIGDVAIEIVQRYEPLHAVGTLSKDATTTKTTGHARSWTLVDQPESTAKTTALSSLDKSLSIEELNDVF
jgi:hypothetical protein